MKHAEVAIIMGSDSDLPVMQKTGQTLAEFGVSYFMTVLSAHRTPDKAFAFAKNVATSGYKVIIAAAGGAAHLAGVIAGNTTLPVIGVPIQSPALSGVDSLYSTVQMPPGVPVATVAINGAQNAGILAVQILAVSDKSLEKKLIQYKKSMAKKVAEKAKKVEAMT